MVDFDADGHQDLLAVVTPGSMKLYRSTGANGSVPETKKVVGTRWQTFRQFSQPQDLPGPEATECWPCRPRGNCGAIPCQPEARGARHRRREQLAQRPSFRSRPLLLAKAWQHKEGVSLWPWESPSSSSDRFVGCPGCIEKSAGRRCALPTGVRARP